MSWSYTSCTRCHVGHCGAARLNVSTLRPARPECPRHHLQHTNSAPNAAACYNIASHRLPSRIVVVNRPIPAGPSSSTSVPSTTHLPHVYAKAPIWYVASMSFIRKRPHYNNNRLQYRSKALGEGDGAAASLNRLTNYCEPGRLRQHDHTFCDVSAPDMEVSKLGPEFRLRDHCANQQRRRRPHRHRRSHYGEPRREPSGRR